MATTDELVTAGDGSAGTPHTRAHMEIEAADPSPPVTGHPPHPERTARMRGIRVAGPSHGEPTGVIRAPTFKNA